MRIARLQVNHITNPFGFDLGDPSFSWVVEDAAGKVATESRVIVMCEAGVVADSGWADLASIATQVTGLAEALEPRTHYTWTVSVRSDAGEEATSEPAWFETGKMDEPWEAQWVACAVDDRHPVFSHTLALDANRQIVSARLYACGLGLYEASIDGTRVGDEYLAPGTNAYDLWLQAQTYDVTDLMHNGAELSFTLGNGWWSGRFGFGGKGAYYGHDQRLIAELHVIYDDGSQQVIGTGKDWMVTRSNVTFSNLYDGEHVDDMLPAVAPVPATLLPADEASCMTGRLHDRLSLPVTTHEEFVPAPVDTPSGDVVLDLGQNIAGIFRLRVCEPAGAVVRLQFGELLQEGEFYRDNLRTALQEFVYVSDGKEHVLGPRFTYYGYRYVRVEGAAHFSSSDFVGVALYSAFDAERGHVTTGHELLNQLVSNTRWGMKDNFVDTATDCPQRDERMGWTGDANVFSRTALYLGAPYAFYRKYLFDMAAEQAAHDGQVQQVVPSFGVGGANSVWGDATTMIAWNLYQMDGDAAVLREHYPAMRAWVDYMAAQDGDAHGWHEGRMHLGDWLALDGHKDEERMGGTDEGFIADLFFWKSASIVMEAARVLGIEEDVARYEKLAASQRAWIEGNYYSATGRCTVNTQTAYALSLEFGFGDATYSSRELVRLLRENGDALTTGFVGTPILLPALSRAGEHRRAYNLLLSEGYPSWLRCIKLGATTIWERWNSLDDDGVCTGTNMNSMNHYAYGSVCQWLWETAAGITPVEPGFVCARIAPQVSWRLRTLDASLDSAAGTWRVAWECVDERHLHVHLVVPFGAKAELELPLAPESAYASFGSHVLAAGKYDFTYETTESVRWMPSVDAPLSMLLANHATTQVLRRYVKHADMVPPQLQGYSVRELVASMPGALTDAQLAVLDAELLQFAE